MKNIDIYCKIDIVSFKPWGERNLNDSVITSKNNNIIKETAKLKIKKYRLNSQLFLVEGFHLVNEAYENKVLKSVFYLDENPFDDIKGYKVTDEVIKTLSDLMVPQGIIGVCEITNNSNIGEKVLLLDNVQDPGNIGTLIRSCVAFGFSTIISENSVDYYNEKVVRSTQGALFKVNLLNGSLSDFIKESKDYDFYVTDLKSDFTLEETEFKNNKLGIILGNEGQGVRQELIDLVDQSFKIKMKNMESLNVGVAGSIIMYEIFKRSKR